MKTSELRKQVSLLYKQGELQEIGIRPQRPARYIYNMRKTELLSVINTNTIAWKQEGEIYKGDNPQKTKSQETKSVTPQEVKGDTPQEVKGDTPKQDKSPQNSKNGKREYVTTKGIINATEVQNDLGISNINNIINDISIKCNEALNLARDKDSTPIVKQFKIGDAEPIILKGEHLHPAFDKILFHTKMDKNVYIYGKAGTGKTTMAKQIADVLGLDFATYSCSAGMSESMLTGKCLFDGTYFSTKFVELVKNGGLILLDEYDAIDGNLGVYMNSFLANGVLPTPNNKNEQEVVRHPDCYIICAGNTTGNGNGSRIYSGRNKLDGATLDRFTIIEFDYDTKLEKKLVAGHISLYNALNELREKVNEFELERIVSTRLYSKLGNWISNGKDLKYCLETITDSWLDSERDKVDVSGIIKNNTLSK